MVSHFGDPTMAPKEHAGNTKFPVLNARLTTGSPSCPKAHTMSHAMGHTVGHIVDHMLYHMVDHTMGHAVDHTMCHIACTLSKFWIT